MYLELAEKATGISTHAGLAYNKGVYNRYMGESSKAVQQLNFARFDG